MSPYRSKSSSRKIYRSANEYNGVTFETTGLLSGDDYELARAGETILECDPSKKPSIPDITTAAHVSRWLPLTADDGGENCGHPPLLSYEESPIETGTLSNCPESLTPCISVTCGSPDAIANLRVATATVQVDQLTSNSMTVDTSTSEVLLSSRRSVWLSPSSSSSPTHPDCIGLIRGVSTMVRPAHMPSSSYTLKLSSPARNIVDHIVELRNTAIMTVLCCGSGFLIFYFCVGSMTT